MLWFLLDTSINNGCILCTYSNMPAPKKKLCLLDFSMACTHEMSQRNRKANHREYVPSPDNFQKFTRESRMKDESECAEDVVKLLGTNLFKLRGCVKHARCGSASNVSLNTTLIF